MNTEFEQAAEALKDCPEDLPKKKEWTEFTVQDSFNPENTLSGFLCHRSNRFYGALLIATVNDEFHPQLIYCTPKLRYPFDKNGKYTFPESHKVEVYEKLDGTNILAYRYKVGDKEFKTFKIRLWPQVGDTKHGPFAALLREVANFDSIFRLMDESGLNVSFELYGAKNKHLIEYEIPIDLCLLFGVDSLGRIYPPSHLKWEGSRPGVFTIKGGDYADEYNTHRAEDENKLKEVEGGYAGTEGRVWYMKTIDGKWSMFKCKPESIEKIHWAGGGLSNNVIRATAWNVLETEDEISYEAVKLLLLEEFDEDKIIFAKNRINKIVEDINFEIKTREKIMEEYRALGVSIEEDKGTVMRHFSKLYNKKLMQRVYTTIVMWKGK
jgi:hypothetical protein